MNLLPRSRGKRNGAKRPQENTHMCTHTLPWNKPNGSKNYRSHTNGVDALQVIPQFAHPANLHNTAGEICPNSSFCLEESENAQPHHHRNLKQSNSYNTQKSLESAQPQKRHNQKMMHPFSSRNMPSGQWMLIHMVNDVTSHGEWRDVTW